MSHNHVVAAIIFHDERILCVQRGISRFPYISYKWEFPGGKVEIDEKYEFALKREIVEELKMEIIVDYVFLRVDHSYQDFAITLHSYLCKCENPSFKLTEHLDFKWLLREELEQLDWAEADKPIVELLMLNK